MLKPGSTLKTHDDVDNEACCQVPSRARPRRAMSALCTGPPLDVSDASGFTGRHTRFTVGRDECRSFTMVDWSLLALGSVAAGSAYLFVDVALRGLNPGIIVCGRLAIGATVLSLVPGARQPVRPGDAKRLKVMAILMLVIPLNLFATAQLWVSTSVVGAMNTAMPLFGATAAAVLLGRRPGRIQIAGLVIGFLGTVVIALPTLTSGPSGSILGISLLLMAVLTVGTVRPMTVPLQQRYGGATVMFRMQFYAALASVPIALAQVRGTEWGVVPVGALMVLGLANTGAAFAINSIFVSRVGPIRATISAYFVPLVAFAIGRFVLHETTSPWLWVGFVLVVAGMWSLSRRDPLTSTLHAGPPPSGQ